MKSNIILVYPLMIFNIVLPTIYLSAQIKDPIPPEKEFREIPDDPYISVKRSAYKTSPAYEFHNQMISTYQVNVNSDGQNMLGDAANEPSIAIDPTNPLHMVIGWRQFDTIASNFRQAGYAFTFDGGVNWNFPGIIEPGVFRSDPCLDNDDQGKFYFNSLNADADFRCDVFITDDPSHWDPGHFAFGGDKPWMAIDRTGGISNGNIYAIWQFYVSSCEGSFAYSFNQGETFDRCDTLPQEMRFGTIAIGPDGELYACGEASGFEVCRSTNAVKEGNDISWDFAEKVDMGGYMLSHPGPNPEGLIGQVWIAADLSGSTSRGNVYLLSTTTSNVDSANIMFSRSTDRAEHWSAPVRINDDDDKGNHWNWFGTMSVATNGRIDVAWLDTRDNNNLHKSALYFSYSIDGGVSWSRNQKLSESFDPHVGYPHQRKMGDYYHMRSDNEGACLAWAATFNGEQDVYYSRILIDEITATKDQAINITSFATLSQNSPNPFRSTTDITFSIQKAGKVNLEIFDPLGNMIKKLVDDYRLPGQYTVAWDGSDKNGGVAINGLYIYKLSVDAKVFISKRMLLMK